MNIIETVKDIIQSFPRISEIGGDVHVDYTDGDADSYGLSPTGNSTLSEDILGNLTNRQTFMLYALYSGINDYERMANSSLLVELSCWLRSRKGTAVTTLIGGVEYGGEIVELSADNGMLIEVPDGDIFRLRYQLQITADYTVITEP